MPDAPTTAVASLSTTRRPLVLGVCGSLFAALLAVAALVPLPFAVTYPGLTRDVLGSYDGEPVIAITGASVRDPKGQLRMTTITATAPHETVRLTDVISGYFASDEAVLPHEAVYPHGDSDEEIEEYNIEQMRSSQDDAVAAALSYLARDDEGIDIRLTMTDVGGASAGLLFSLGIVDLLKGNGEGGDLTGGEIVAGTGTIATDGSVGEVGGVALKTRAAKRDGATIFLLPRGDCSNAASPPDGLRLVPVSSLQDAVQALKDLAAGRPVPSC